jgi:hypothetical protein
MAMTPLGYTETANLPHGYGKMGHSDPDGRPYKVKNQLNESASIGLRCVSRGIDPSLTAG